MNSRTNLLFLQNVSRGLPASAIKTSAGDMAPFLVEERGLYLGKASAVILPKTVGEVSNVVKEAAKAQVSIVPQGGNTGLVGGQVPFDGILLSLSRMNEIRAVDPLNGTITVAAGCTLQAVQEAAAAAGCLFPLSLASEGSCQIGGNIASNAGGTAVLRYGNMRDLVLGLEVVLPDGRIWNGLRALRKDNAGYDLKHLFIGSEGTLGIITAAVLKIFPAIRSRVTAFIGLASPESALEVFGMAKAEFGDLLSAFEIMPRFGLEIVIKHMPGHHDPLENPHPFYALIEFSSISAKAELGASMEQLLERALERGLVQDGTIAASENQSKALWSLRENMSWAQKPEGGSIKHDVSVPVSKVAEFIDKASALCRAEMAGLRVCAFGHMGDGNIHFNLSQPEGMDKAEFLAQWPHFNRIVHDLVVAMGGSIAAEHGIGILKREELAHYKDEVSLDLMRMMKRALDPENRLNPGKIIDISGSRS